MDQPNAQPQPKKSNTLIFVIGCLLITIFILIVILLIVILAQKPTQIKSPPKPPSKPAVIPPLEEKEEEEEVITETKEESLPKKIAYLDNYNVWIMADDGSDKRQITPDGSVDTPYTAIAFKDLTHLSYVKCPDLNHCNQIHTYNLETDAALLEAEVSSTDYTYIHTLAWSQDGETLAYLYYDPDEDLNLVYIKKGAEERRIKEIPIALGGRGGSFDDAQYLKFSPNGQKLLLVHTFNLPMDDQPSIFVFDTESGDEHFSLETSPEGWATHGYFVDNNFLGYKRGNQIIKRHIINGTETVLVTVPQILNPAPSPDENFIAFWTYSEEESANLYLFDVADSYTQVTDNMSHPQWLSESNLLGYKTEECVGDCMLNYQISGLARYNRDTDTTNTLLESATVADFQISPQ